MATLENQATGERVILFSSHVFGRGRTGVDTALEGMDISHVHASIRWEGEHWELFDHSRNGTWMDGERILHDSVVLHRGHVIRFGASRQSIWKMVDVSSPLAMLVPMQGGEAKIELKQLHVLPDMKNPEISIYRADSGHWVQETAAGVNILNDGDRITIGEKTWQYFSAKVVDSTLGIGEYKHVAIGDIVVHFRVSLDEEHVEMTISHDVKTFDLSERVHHYLLLILARQRLQDAQSGVDVDSQGWIEVEQVTKMLHLDLTYINIQIFRARKQVADALPDVSHLLQVVERRPGSIRFGFPYFRIMRGSKLQGEITV